MAKRDKNLTIRNKRIRELSIEIKVLLPSVLKLTGYISEHSLNAKYGGKYAEYIDIKNEVINSPEQFRTSYFSGFLEKLENLGYFAKRGNHYFDAYTNYRDNKKVQLWLHFFLERTYLRNYEALSKVRPKLDESFMWIGQENASYGIFITPEFRVGKWINDESEIRHFKPLYWTIGHILETGLVIPTIDEKMEFNDLDDYLIFFKNVLVRNSGSIHERNIADRYCEYVKKSPDANDIPLLIPEFRYGGLEKKHKYRLDFTIINPYNMTKVGFELSPWSTHGELKGTKNKKQYEINAEARENFEKEMKKQKSFFRKYKIPYIVFTDSNLKNYDSIFETMTKYLNIDKPPKQLELQIMKDFLSFKA